MKGIHFVMMTIVATCFLATSVQSLKCYDCSSYYDEDPDCIDPDLMQITDMDTLMGYPCKSCSTYGFTEEMFQRMCSYDKPTDQDPPVQYSTNCSGDREEFCWCNTDLCNGKGGTITHKSRTTTMSTTSVASSETSTGGGTRGGTRDGTRGGTSGGTRDGIRGGTDGGIRGGIRGGTGNRHTGKPKTSSGEQKTVSSRVLIAGVTTAMLSLAQLF